MLCNKYGDYYMAIFISCPISPETPISARMPKARGLDWYGIWYENCHIIIYLSYIFLSDKFTHLISYAESKARPPSAPNEVIRVFCPGKTAVSPMWPGHMGFFLPGQKSRITNATHSQTFCAPQEWYVLESHASITYAKWTYFLVNVW